MGSQVPNNQENKYSYSRFNRFSFGSVALGWINNIDETPMLFAGYALLVRTCCIIRCSG